MKRANPLAHLLPAGGALSSTLTTITALLAATADASVLLSWVAVEIMLFPVLEIFQWLSEMLFP